MPNKYALSSLERHLREEMQPTLITRWQAAVHSDVMEALQQEITHPLLFSRKNLCLMTARD